MSVEIFRTPMEMAEAAAKGFAARAVEAVSARGRFTAALSGGKTPVAIYTLLAKAPFVSQIPWAHVHLFWGDERCVPADDPRSNARMVERALLDHLSMRPEQLHRIPCDRSPRHAAEQYEAELRRYFADESPRFDLAFLGLGEDGHTASLLPGSDALAEQVRWTAVTRRPDEEYSRVTVTAPLLNQASLVVLLVTGRTKARALRHLDITVTIDREMAGTPALESEMLLGLDGRPGG